MLTTETAQEQKRNRLLTSSRLKAARACQRLHFYEYIEGYRPILPADVLRFGTLVHRGLEAWWKAKQAGLSPAEWAESAFAAMDGEADSFEHVRALEMLHAYHLRWKDEPYEVLAVEVRFETSLVNPATNAASRTWELSGKIDAVVRDLRDGRVLLVEHKTSSEDVSPGSEYWKRLRMDGQISVYFEGGKSLGYDVSGCLYDVLAKPAQRPGNVPLTDEDGVKIVLDAAGQRVKTKDGKKWRQTADTEAGYVLQTRPETPDEFRVRLVEAIAKEPDRYLARGEVVRLEQELAEAQFDNWQQAQQLREAELAGRFPRNPDSCSRYGRTCWAFDICTGAGSLDDTTRFRKLESVHPELEQADASAG